ncbi:alpha/beta hydrolase [Lactiplantibacillus paraplantarum]|uniref:alpha/beta hydrolase n=2 Tax=Lactiplantibacillus paraplantarum TaxID=60520 RepID=UPI0011C03016|nr:alpha/beta hydrolase [Lactiplantibacillus paraplantarum]
MATKGYVTMVYDYSFIGASQGQPRGNEDPEVKASDIHSAVSFLATYPNVDADRLGAIGICGSGVYLPYETLREDRLKAIVSVNPFTVINTVETAPQEEILKQKAKYDETGEATRLDLIEPGSEGAEYYFDYQRGAAVNRVEFVSWSQLDWQKFNPTELAKGLTQPYLMVCGENAFTRPGAEVMFNNAVGADKQLIIIPEARHFDLYDGEKYVPAVIEDITEFLASRV